MWNNRMTMVVAGMLIVPVLCCLIGVGVLLQLTSAEQAADAHEPVSAVPPQPAIAGLTRTAERLAEQLNDKRQEIVQLEEQWRNAVKRDEAERARERDLEDQCARSLDAMTQLREELAGLRQRALQAGADPADLEYPVGPIVHPLVDQQQLAELQRQANSLGATRSGLEHELRVTRGRYAGLTAQQEQLKRELQKARKTFVLPPLHGDSTHLPRPSLYVECSAGEVVVQPEGVRLSSGMSAGEQTAFLTRAKRTGYVVFLIRPNGLRTFYAYRGLVMSENHIIDRKIEIGFEPVDADWHLVY